MSIRVGKVHCIGQACLVHRGESRLDELHVFQLTQLFLCLDAFIKGHIPRLVV